MTRVKRAGVVSKVVEHVPSKHEVLSLNPNTTKKKKKKNPKIQTCYYTPIEKIWRKEYRDANKIAHNLPADETTHSTQM
jgi:hypothetical protein